MLGPEPHGAIAGIPSLDMIRTAPPGVKTCRRRAVSQFEIRPAIFSGSVRPLCSPASGAKRMPDWIARLAREWRVIADAPFSFATAVALVADGIWVVVRWRFQAIVEHRN